VKATIRALARVVKDASPQLAATSSAQRDQALHEIAEALLRAQTEIIAANRQDLEAARAAAMSSAMLDRLALDERRVTAMASAVRELIALPDPLGGLDAMWVRPNGLRVGRRRIPLGVIAIIYEARPNVTSDAAALCIKSGNGVILKGGKEAFASNRAIVAAMREGLAKAGLPESAMAFIDSTQREATQALLELDELVDVVIPRGGEGLIRFVAEHARMPVIKHYKGVCHVFVEASAQPEMVESIALNAKCQRPSVCNAMECLLVDAAWPAAELQRVVKALLARGVRIHACPKSLARLEPNDALVPAVEDDWGCEYLAMEMALKTVENLDEAMQHIQRFGSQHTDAIITERYALAERFLAEVDSSTVLVNASTRFADGGELGLGAEMGISTSKLHAFGPMGLRELTTTKFVVYGSGQVRS
jgi:glutamate-5-semialdehyde dehydrogenase